MKATHVIDTNVVSYRFKGDSRAVAYARYFVGEVPALSFMTIAELYRWSMMHRWGARRVESLRTMFADYIILHSDELTAHVWAQLMSVRGRPMNANDAWIAATAFRHGLPLVTHNRSHFEHINGLDLISEA